MLKLKQQSIAGFSGFIAQSQSSAASPPAFLGQCIHPLPKAARVKEKLCGLQHGISGETFMGLFSATTTSPLAPGLMVTLLPPSQPRLSGVGCVSIPYCTAHPVPHGDCCFSVAWIHPRNNICLSAKQQAFIHCLDQVTLNHIFGYYLTPGCDLLS